MKKEILEVFHERKVRHDELYVFDLEENIIVLYHDADPLADVKQKIYYIIYDATSLCEISTVYVDACNTVTRTN